MAGPAGIEPTSPSSKHGILSIELRADAKMWIIFLKVNYVVFVI